MPEQEPLLVYDRAPVLGQRFLCTWPPKRLEDGSLLVEEWVVRDTPDIIDLLDWTEIPDDRP